MPDPRGDHFFKMPSIYLDFYFKKSANVHPGRGVGDPLPEWLPAEGFEQQMAPKSGLRVVGNTLFVDAVRGTLLQLHHTDGWLFTTVIGEDGNLQVIVIPILKDPLHFKLP